jgi:hypothetical protein
MEHCHTAADADADAVGCMQVYCEIVSKDGQDVANFSNVISCLDPRTAAQVMHSTHGAHGSYSKPGSTSHTISSEQYLIDKHGVRLQLPSCPCIVVELSKNAWQRYSTAGAGSSSSSNAVAAEQSSSSTPNPDDQELYRTYPLEFCWWVAPI